MFHILNRTRVELPALQWIADRLRKYTQNVHPIDQPLRTYIWRDSPPQSILHLLCAHHVDMCRYELQDSQGRLML